MYREIERERIRGKTKIKAKVLFFQIHIKRAWQGAE